jgi:hypothetical protein
VIAILILVTMYAREQDNHAKMPPVTNSLLIAAVRAPVVRVGNFSLVCDMSLLFPSQKRTMVTNNMNLRFSRKARAAYTSTTSGEGSCVIFLEAA